MYNKKEVKNYAKGVKAKRSYKRNASGSDLLTAVRGESNSRFDKWAKGRKSKWARGKKNPSERVSPEVEDMSKEWHGRGNKYTTDVEEIETFEEDVAELADLEELGVIKANRKDTFDITFKKGRPKLCCDGEGHNLEIIGGNQELDLDGIRINHGDKVLVPVGYVCRIVYETDKHHLEGSTGYPEPYEHYFGEEYYKSKIDPDGYGDNMDKWFEDLLLEGWVDKAIDKGLLPIMVYNQTDNKILLTGGEYEVKDVGISN